MPLMTLILVIFTYGIRGGEAVITRTKGVLLFSLWLGYIVFLYKSALAA